MVKTNTFPICFLKMFSQLVLSLNMYYLYLNLFKQTWTPQGALSKTHTIHYKRYHTPHATHTQLYRRRRRRRRRCRRRRRRILIHVYTHTYQHTHTRVCVCVCVRACVCVYVCVGNLPKQAVEHLHVWLKQHWSHPYPTDQDKQVLSA